jgi:hypothetical protein
MLMTYWLDRETFNVVFKESLDLLGMSQECFLGSALLAIVEDQLASLHIHSYHHIVIVLIVD